MMTTAELYDSKEKDLKNSLYRIGDLINLEGPLLSLFFDIRTYDLYIFDWVDQLDNEINRWLVYKIPVKLLNSFLRKEVSYKYIFNISLEATHNAYIADIANFKENQYQLKKMDNIPKDYYPDEEIYFELKDAKNISTITKIVSIIISKEINLVTGGLNYIPLEKEYLDSTHSTQNYFKTQITVVMPGFIEQRNNLEGNTLYKIQSQQNVRETNRILEKKGLGIYAR